MKRFLILLVAAAVWACSDPVAPAGPPVQLSVPEVEIEAGGGTVDVSVVTGPDWTVSVTSGDWLTARRKNVATLSLSAPANTTGSLRMGAVRVSLGEEHADLQVIQPFDPDPGADADLGARMAEACDFIGSVTGASLTVLAEGCKAWRMTATGPVNGTESPLALFLLEADLTAGLSLCVTCVDDENGNIILTDATAGKRQTIREQLAALQSRRSGIRVLGGVNGDFYLTKRNNLLQGVVHRGGVCVKDSFDGGDGCNVFALMQDGTARVMTQAEYAGAKGSIQEALGGRQVLLRQGSVVSRDKTLEPRTAAGVSADGKKVYLLAVDGRREGWSVGASYPMLAAILQVAGASDAVNLDGGGSTTFVVRSGDTPVFTTWNRPSDGKDRAVVNGLAVVAAQ